MFSISEIKAGIKANLKGRFLWSRYVKYGNHDHKFGPNVFDYIAQIPVIGLIFVLIVFSVLWAVVSLICTLQKLSDPSVKSQK